MELIAMMRSFSPYASFPPALSRSRRYRFALLAVILSCSSLGASAAEFFVNRNGSETGDGRSPETAFATIQKGVLALTPGDTLTIGPGEYEEQVLLSDFGDSEKETLIRAAIPGTVLIRGDRDVEGEFQIASGKKFTYSINWSQDALSVYEVDTMRLFDASPGLGALEFGPGKFFKAPGETKLFLSSSDLKPPGLHRYRVGVVRGNGFELNGVKGVVLEGLAVSGFTTAVGEERLGMPTSGFFLYKTTNCIVRNCTAFSNRSGIVINNESIPVAAGSAGVIRESHGKGNLVEGCTTYGNLADGVVVYEPNGDTMRDSRSYLNRSYGFRFYGNRCGDDVSSMSGLLAWGNPGGDYWMKGNGLSEGSPKAIAERCIALGDATLAYFSHIITGGASSHKANNPSSISLPQETSEFLKFADREFADPANQDFRLQGDSALRSSAPDGKARGAHPYQGNVRYVSPNGNDQSDGLSVKSAWGTLAHALRSLKAGDTLYLTQGRYTGFPALSLRDVHIRARGTELAVIEGPVLLKGGDSIVFERLQFAGNVRTERSKGVAFENCTFRSALGLEAQGVTGLTVRHGILGGPLTLKGSSKVFLAGNLYAITPAVVVDNPDSIAFSDYNSYPAEKNCWKIGGRKLLSRTELTGQGERRSIVQVPKWVEQNGALELTNAHSFAGRGPLGSSIGNFRVWKPVEMEIAGLSVHSKSNHSVNIEWWTSLPGEVVVSWGEPPSLINREVLRQTAFNSYSLTGLTPGKKYSVRVTPKRITPRTDSARRFSVSAQAAKAIEFTIPTAPERQPATFYVATDGSDSKSGLSREAAWKTLQHAADQARPGDTVLIAGGSYPESVYFRNSGEEGKPITFKAAPGEKVVLDGRGLKIGFVLFGKSHYRFDALYFEGFEGIPDNVARAECGAIMATGGSDLQITRSFFTKGWGPALAVEDCSGALVQNCSFMHSMSAASFAGCASLRIENNVFVNPLIMHLTVSNEEKQPARIANNIFGENTRGKVQIPFLSIPASTASNNAFYIRWPETERTIFAVGLDGITLPEVEASGIQTRSVVANPQMMGAKGWKQGWGQFSPETLHEYFTANPELIVRDIGLQPEAFADFNHGDWTYDKAWAEKMLAQIAAARELRQAGKDAEALVAFESAADGPMHERLRSELLDEAAQCAQRLGDYDKAMELARKIPIEAISGRCQMALMVAQGKYGELLNQFTNAKMGGRAFLTHWIFPETEHLMGDLYYHRAIAYAETGDLDAAEADLKVMVEKDAKLQYTPGVDVVDTAWVRLGDFYHQYRKNDALALEAYNQVIVRKVKFLYRDHLIPKPVLLGTSASLAAATDAASKIYLARGNSDKAREVQSGLLIAQAEAFAAQNDKGQMLSKFTEAVTMNQLLTPAGSEYVKQVEAMSEDAARASMAAVAESVTTLSATAKKRLLESVAAQSTKARALAILIAFAPPENAKLILEKAKEQAKRSAAL